MTEQRRDDLTNPPFYWSEVEEILNGSIEPFGEDDVGSMPEEAPGDCPQCDKPMVWTSWRNSDDCWANDCGSAGWLPVCRTCHRWGELIETCIS